LKICTKCKQGKLLEDFSRDSQKSDGRYSSCKTCNKRKEYFDGRKDEKSKYDRLRYDDNSCEIKVATNAYYRKNKKELNRKQVANINENPNRKLKAILRKRINKLIKRTTKVGSAVVDLGCTVEELKKYLESKFSVEMDWTNHGFGEGKWQIDHIKPLCGFDLTDRNQFLEACHYTNLQPLWYHDHLLKTKNDLRAA
jgi:hypothetical protein